MHRRPILAGTVAVVLLGATAVGLARGWLGGPTPHDLSVGPLSISGSGRSDQALALVPVNAGKTHSVAIPLCVAKRRPASRFPAVRSSERDVTQHRGG